jgi:hypothetical protein
MVSRKPHASRASVWERRKSAHVLDARSGAGSMSASLRISHTVDGATFTPSTSSSPVHAPVPPPGGCCPEPGAAPGCGWSTRWAAGPVVSVRIGTRAALRSGCGASAAPCPGVPATASGKATPVSAGAIAPPKGPDPNEVNRISFRPVGVPAPRRNPQRVQTCSLTCTDEVSASARSPAGVIGIRSEAKKQPDGKHAEHHCHESL